MKKHKRYGDSVIISEEDEIVCNELDDVFRGSKGKYITASFAKRMGFQEVNRKKVTDEKPLELPMMNFEPEDENHKHHKKVHQSLVTQTTSKEEQPLGLPMMNFEPEK